MDTSYRKVLQKTILFQNISVDESFELIACLSPQVKHFSKNEILLKTGDSVKHLGIILSGSANAYLEHINGDYILMANLTTGRMFGEVLVSTRSHLSPVTVYAKTDAAAAFIEFEKVCSLCAAVCPAHSALLQNLLKAIGDKYFSLFDRINILSGKSLRARIMAYLYTLSGRGENRAVTLPFTKTMLADYLLANRSALSKELYKMERDGLIAVNGREIEISFFNDKLSFDCYKE